MKTPKPKTELTPVIVYLRKSHSSDDEQENSIPRQKAECEAYCERKGYSILSTYTDQASGSKDQDKRIHFARMLKDIASGTDAKAVVCWNRACFGRMDAYDGGDAIRILRSAGLILDTAREGEFNFAESSGRWKDYALSEGGKLFAETLSTDSLSGRINALRSGYWPNGAVPYGYDRDYILDGTHTIIPRNKPAARPKGSKLKLVKNDKEAAIVAEIFDRFADADVSLVSIANDLNGRKIPAPDTIQKKKQRTRTGNEGWNADTIKAMLKNAAYLGIGSIGGQRKRNRQAFNRAEHLQVPNVCPVLVDKDTFATIQEKLKRRSEDARNVQPRKAGTLSGFVFCGHCRFRCGKRDQKGTRYICSSPGKRPHLGCKQWSIREDVLMPMVQKALVANVDVELLARAEARPVTQKVSDREILDTQADTLRVKITTAESNYLEAPKQLLSGLAGKLLDMKGELEELERRISLEDAIGEQGALAGFGQWWNEVKDSLVPLEDRSFDPEDLWEKFKPTTDERKDIDRQLKKGKAELDGREVKRDEGGKYRIQTGTNARPQIHMTKENFRSLLDTLGVKIWVFWDTDAKHYFPPILDVKLEVDVKYTSPDHNKTTIRTSNTA